MLILRSTDELSWRRLRVSGKRASRIRDSTGKCRVRIVDECTFPVTVAGSGRAPGETRRVSQIPGPDERAGPADHGADGPVRVSGDQFPGRRVNPAHGSGRILIISDLPRWLWRAGTSELGWWTRTRTIGRRQSCNGSWTMPGRYGNAWNRKTGNWGRPSSEISDGTNRPKKRNDRRVSVLANIDGSNSILIKRLIRRQESRLNRGKLGRGTASRRDDLKVSPHIYIYIYM